MIIVFFTTKSCLHAFITEKILKGQIKDGFKINKTQTIKIYKKGEYVKFKNFERKVKWPRRIYAEVLEDHISSMIEESIYWSYLMKKHFKKSLWWVKNIIKILRTLINVGSVIMIKLIMMLK